MNPPNNRLQWFIDRIGKRVFRNNNGCACVGCKDVYEHGLVITDKFHADYLCDTEGDYNAGGDLLRYFDARDEALVWEAENQKDKL